MKNEKIIKIIRIVTISLAVIFLLAAFLAPLANAIRISTSTIDRDYGSAYAYLFGGQLYMNGKEFGKKSIEILSIFGLISFAFMIGALVLLVLCGVSKKLSAKSRTLLLVIAGAALFVASILFLCGKKEYVTINVSTLYTNVTDSIVTTNLKNASLLFGFWGPAMFAILSSLSLAVYLIFTDSFKLLKRVKNEK